MRQGFFQMVRPCPNCHGTGRIITDKCDDCGGTGQRPRRRSLTVRVPPGIHDGQVIRVPDEGEPGQDGPRGDLHVVVRIRDHELFERDGNDLILRMPISFTQAALGAELEVPSLDGHCELKIPRATQHGQVFTLRDKGMPDLRSGRRGNMLVQALVEIPRKLSDEQEELLRQFAETEDHRVLPESDGFWKKIKSYLTGE